MGEGRATKEYIFTLGRQGGLAAELRTSPTVFGQKPPRWIFEFRIFSDNDRFEGRIIIILKGMIFAFLFFFLTLLFFKSFFFLYILTLSPISITGYFLECFACNLILIYVSSSFSSFLTSCGVNLFAE